MAWHEMAASLPPCTPAPLTLLAVMPTMPRADKAFTTFGNRHGRIMAYTCSTLKRQPCHVRMCLKLALLFLIVRPCRAMLAEAVNDIEGGCKVGGCQ